MSLRLEMLQVARLAPRLLSDSAELVHDFVLGQLNGDGGFKDRQGVSDLYYTVFGIDSLAALQVEIPTAPIEKYLGSLGAGEGLDLVHLTCLARCWASVPGADIPPSARQSVLERLEDFRAADGGYHNAAGNPAGTIYGCFLTLGAYQDLGADFPDPKAMADFIASRRCPDGGYANQPDLPAGSTPATAAAVTLLRHVGAEAPSEAGDWLLDRSHPQGGFVATPKTPVPDLLSTAVTLHGLAGMQRDFGKVKDACLDFIDTLWTNSGSFYGTWAEDVLDCEYTYYGLLALGHLSL